jgi:4'-phosphopantetheinyl transferase
MKIIRKKIDFNLSKNKFEYFLNYVNEKEKEKILKYRRYEDSLRSLYGKMILKDILNLSKVELEYNKWGKPKLLNNN